MDTSNGSLNYLKELAETLTQRDKKLWERNKLVKLVFDNCPTDLIIYAVDTELVITLSAGRGLESLGLKEDDVLGLSFYDYFQTQDKNSPPIKYHLLALKGESHTYDFKWENKTWHIHCSPIKDEDGNITGVTGCGFDITEYIEQDNKIKELEKILQCKESCSDSKVEKIKKIV